ncbi:hypothetical protein COO60DRAFT_66978 [Scenedesmus sp. NREL 46B-D3]|nr:hypothetical protein COO60DRAFT_66978 [Scenedesmus sp. NREL 46B-D3]
MLTSLATPALSFALAVFLVTALGPGAAGVPAVWTCSAGIIAAGLWLLWTLEAAGAALLGPLFDLVPLCCLLLFIQSQEPQGQVNPQQDTLACRGTQVPTSQAANEVLQGTTMTQAPTVAVVKHLSDANCQLSQQDAELCQAKAAGLAPHTPQQKAAGKVALCLNLVEYGAQHEPLAARYYRSDPATLGKLPASGVAAAAAAAAAGEYATKFVTYNNSGRIGSLRSSHHTHGHQLFSSISSSSAAAGAGEYVDDFVTYSSSGGIGSLRSSHVTYDNLLFSSSSSSSSSGELLPNSSAAANMRVFSKQQRNRQAAAVAGLAASTKMPQSRAAGMAAGRKQQQQKQWGTRSSSMTRHAKAAGRRAAVAAAAAAAGSSSRSPPTAIGMTAGGDTGKQRWRI